MDVLRLPLTPYHQVWDMQRSLAAARAEGTIPDTLLLVEHPSVYTAGRRTQPWERPLDGTEVVDVDRGGKITWHGPGQLVGYPILLLPVPLDVVAYVRTLEAALIASCTAFGLASRRVPGRSGVWTADGQRKIAAIGVRVRRRVAYHGFALNCCPDLAAFDRIVPCGIADATVTSLSGELGRTVGLDEALPPTERAVLTHLAAFLAARRVGDALATRAATGAAPMAPMTVATPARPEPRLLEVAV